MKHDYTWYVALRLGTVCRCGAPKPSGPMLCPACIDRLPRGDRILLRRPPLDRRFAWAVEACDRALAHLGLEGGEHPEGTEA